MFTAPDGVRSCRVQNLLIFGHPWCCAYSFLLEAILMISQIPVLIQNTSDWMQKFGYGNALSGNPGGACDAAFRWRSAQALFCFLVGRRRTGTSKCFVLTWFGDIARW